jgi:regulator of protease activity HflC (stomatin/prohibitin superfamily)
MDFPIPIIILILIYIASSIKILREYERGVIYRLGRILKKAKGPGMILVFAPIDKMVKVSLRTVTMEVPPQDIISRDNVSMKVSAVVYFRAMDPNLAVNEVEDYLFATSQMSQTTLRSVLGQCEMDDLLSEREKINHHLQELLDKQTGPWGIKVANVEIKHVDLPQEMQRAMARQAEAERERRAKIISAEGEFQSAEKLVQAAQMIEKHPAALQLRYLQTLSEVASENNSTTIFPVPIDFLSAFMPKQKE